MVLEMKKNNLNSIELHENPLHGQQIPFYEEGILAKKTVFADTFQ